MAESLPIDLGPEKGVERRLQSGAQTGTSQGFQGIPATPEYASESSRENTFNEDWPHDKHLAWRLVRDGFLYTGYEDCTKCFFCGISLKSWESDAEPWKVHARRNKNCSFLCQNYGEAEVDREWRSAKKENKKQYARKIEESERPLQLDVQNASQTLQDTNGEIEQLGRYITRLMDENISLRHENQMLQENNVENDRKYNDYTTTHMKREEELVRENQKHKATIQEFQSGEIFRQLNDNVKDLEKRIKDLQQANQEKTQNVQMLINHSNLETYIWKREVRAKGRECAMVNDLRRVVMAEKEQLQVDKENIATVVRTLSEELQFLNRTITQLEEQLKVNREAQAACFEFGCSREMVMKAFLEWDKRHGCKAADLMEILIEVNGEWQAPHDEGQMDRQVDQLEGAVGGQVCLELSVDVAEHRTSSIVEEENDGIVAPSGCPYREHVG